jgi:hypothetical protein
LSRETTGHGNRARPLRKIFQEENKMRKIMTRKNEERLMAAMYMAPVMILVNPIAAEHITAR